MMTWEEREDRERELWGGLVVSVESERVPNGQLYTTVEHVM
jgi:hypothetical protein